MDSGKFDGRVGGLAGGMVWIVTDDGAGIGRGYISRTGWGFVGLEDQTCVSLFKGPNLGLNT